jgi:putative hydrolases of HD superfamily
MVFQNLSDFFFELSVLKKLPRSGSFIAGIRNPDTVGEHVFRASEIAFILADLEGANAEHSAFLAMIHDNGEARINDHHKIMSRYMDSKQAEKTAFFDQCEQLPEKTANKFREAFEEFEAQETLEAKCAKDADLLELAFEAKEQLEHGYTAKKAWLEAVSLRITTASAKQLFEALVQKSVHDWWKNLKK